MPYLSYPGQTAEPPLSHRDLSEKWAKKVAFASITGLNGTIDLVSRTKPVEGATVGRKGTDRGMLASYTGNVADGLVWSSLKPVPNTFTTGLSFLVFANPAAQAAQQRVFFLGDETAVGGSFNQASFQFNCDKTGTPTSGLFSAFEYNFGFQGTGQSTAGMVDGKWHVFIASRPVGFGSFTLYRDGVNVTASGDSANGAVLNNGCRLHVNPGATIGYTGNLSLAVAFNTPLTLAEVVELSANPWQIFEARSFTWFFTPSAGGTAYYQDVAGSITAAGALTKQTAKPLAGSSTYSGSIAKQTAKSYTGSLTAAGAVAKQTAKSFAGSITGSGALSTMILFTAEMAGSITPSGAISKMTLKALAGASTLAGAITKKTFRTLDGNITVAGAITKLTTKAFSGTVTVAGALTESYQVLKALAGSVTPSGALGAVYIAFVAGVLKLLSLMGVGQ